MPGMGELDRLTPKFDPYERIAELEKQLRAAEAVAFTGLIRCRRCGRTLIWERKRHDRGDGSSHDIEIINECCSQAGKWQARAEAAKEEKQKYSSSTCCGGVGCNSCEPQGRG